MGTMAKIFSFCQGPNFNKSHRRTPRRHDLAAGSLNYRGRQNSPTRIWRSRRRGLRYRYRPGRNIQSLAGAGASSSSTSSPTSRRAAAFGLSRMEAIRFADGMPMRQLHVQARLQRHGRLRRSAMPYVIPDLVVSRQVPDGSLECHPRRRGVRTGSEAATRAAVPFRRDVRDPHQGDCGQYLIPVRRPRTLSLHFRAPRNRSLRDSTRISRA